MPFLLCFSYRLYYQYIFIYFSASSSDKENSSIIFLITSSVNNSPFSFFSCRRCRCRFQTAKQCRFHRTYIFHTLKKHRKTNCCANNNNNCNDDPGWKLQICRENPRPGQEKKYTSTNQHSPSCNREISPGCNNRPGQECITTPIAAKIPKISPFAEISILTGFPLVAIRYVPDTARIIAAICILLIRFLFQTAITIAIKTTFRL